MICKIVDDCVLNAVVVLVSKIGLVLIQIDCLGRLLVAVQLVEMVEERLVCCLKLLSFVGESLFLLVDEQVLVVAFG